MASRDDLSINIYLTEDVVFLSDPGGRHSDNASLSPAVLRGRLRIKVAHPTKIKAITLKFYGESITKWPVLKASDKIAFEEVGQVANHVWSFFSAESESRRRTSTTNDSSSTHIDDALLPTTASIRTPRKASFIRPQESAITRSIKKFTLLMKWNPNLSGRLHLLGGADTNRFYTFSPGTYEYDFELLLDTKIPETIDVKLGSVKYELQATVKRAEAFRADLVGLKQVTLIRTPAAESLEQSEPMGVSRNWNNDLHYKVIISGKSFPLGAQIPIAFTFTPLTNVRCNRIRIQLVEKIEYFCLQKKMHRQEPGCTMQLFEKCANSVPKSTFPGSIMRIVSGSGMDQNLPVNEGQGNKNRESSAEDLSRTQGIEPTAFEVDVQLPNCQILKTQTQRLHFDTTYQDIQVKHSIAITMRFHRVDDNKRSKHKDFELSMRTPCRILSCRATQENSFLPPYSVTTRSDSVAPRFECGCADAAPQSSSKANPMPVPLIASDESAINFGQLDNPPTSVAIEPPDVVRISHDCSTMPLPKQPSRDPPAFKEQGPALPIATPPPLYQSSAGFMRDSVSYLP